MTRPAAVRQRHQLRLRGRAERSGRPREGPGRRGQADDGADPEQQGDSEGKPTGGAVIRIVDRGLGIYPTTVRVRTANGMDFVHEIPVEHWLMGRKEYELDVAASAGAVTRVEVDPDGYAPDIDRTNNFWPRGR